VLEKLDTATGKWVPCGRVDPSKTEADITGLEPGKQYQFRVKAVNDEGESTPLETDHSIIAKNPFDVATAPGLPELIDWDENSVKLKWEPPMRDGGAPIQGYVIEVMDRDTGDFVRSVECPGQKCQGTVPKLTEGKQYKFRVRALNKAGKSEPSEETSWHTAKPRFCKWFSTLYSEILAFKNYAFFFIIASKSYILELKRFLLSYANFFFNILEKLHLFSAIIIICTLNNCMF
jgi:predicted phage tail protein